MPRRHWTVTPSHRHTAVARLLPDLEAAWRLQGERVNDQVIRFRCGDQSYYLKRYTTPRRFHQRLPGHNRAVREWHNLQWFHRMGIPTAPLVAFGLERRFGLFQRGVLVTEALPGCLDLARMARRDHPRLGDGDWLRQVSDRLALITRRMHQARFCHNDLKWRNVLVEPDSDSPAVYLIDCPTGRRWPFPFLGFRKLKDLACLDKVGRKRLRRTQRLRFYLTYAGRSRLTATDKRAIRKIVRMYADEE